jgi:hypothetical protein
MTNKKKAAYDHAQKLGERIERMANEEGWKEVLIPSVAKKRIAAQIVINLGGVNERDADYNRGLLEAYDFILNYSDSKRAQAMKIMGDNVR